MPGPPRKPSHLKVVEGTQRADRANPREPQPKRKRPSRPPWLSANGRKHWPELVRELDGMGVLTTADKTGLALLCEALAEYLEARQVIADAGALTYESETKQGGVMIRAHPAAALASDAFRRAVAVAKEFGLTPAARARVEAEPETDADPLEEFLGRSRRAGRG